MKHRILVKVQLPDGTHDLLPVVGLQNDQQKVIEHDTERDAREWARFILPDRVTIKEVQQ